MRHVIVSKGQFSRIQRECVFKSAACVGTTHGDILNFKVSTADVEASAVVTRVTYERDRCGFGLVGIYNVRFDAPATSP